ncbi:MAG: hypothetical protein OXT07_10350 [bacterium]|nr:hypothetical protein [bacterium]
MEGGSTYGVTIGVDEISRGSTTNPIGLIGSTTTVVIPARGDQQAKRSDKSEDFPASLVRHGDHDSQK